MAATSVPRLGSQNAGADNYANFLKVFSGEVLEAFEDINVMRPLVMNRTITSGESAQFPVTGAASVAYHTVGDNIIEDGSYLQNIRTHEKTVIIDNILTSNVLISDIDEAMNHYDVRGPFARALGRALAERYDRHLMQVITGTNGASRAAGFLATPSGVWDQPGSSINDLDFNTSASSAIDTMFTAAQTLDEKDIPSEGRFFVITPALYYLLADENELVSTDYNRNTGGDRGLGRILQIAGFDIYKSNRIADLQAVGTQSTGESGQRGSDYGGAFGDVVGVFGQRQCAGTVSLIGMSVQMEYKIEYQATLAVARYAVGHGVLYHPACGAVHAST